MAASVLAACGGNGDDDDDRVTVDANKAYVNLATQAGNWDLTGTGSDGHTYRLVVTDEPGAVAPFPRNKIAGLTQLRTVQSSTDGDELSEPFTATAWYSRSNQVEMGEVQDDGSCLSTTDGQVPPADAQTGDHGGLFNYLTYATCDSDVSIDHGHGNWSVEEIDGTTFFCQKDTFAETGSSLINTSNECHEVDAAGTIGSRALISFVNPIAGEPTFTLTVKNY